VRSEETFRRAASLTDEDISAVVLRNIRDPLGADLLVRILRRDPQDRPDMAAVLAHPYFADPSICEPASKQIAALDAQLRTRLAHLDLQAEAVRRATVRQLSVSDAALLQVKKTDAILLRSVLRDTATATATATTAAGEPFVPTCFVIVKEKLTDNTPLLDMFHNDWIQQVQKLAATEKELFLYFMDEFTMCPILPTSDASKNYPLVIKNPSQFVPEVLPLLTLTAKAAAVVHRAPCLLSYCAVAAAAAAEEGTLSDRMTLAISQAGATDTAESLLSFGLGLSPSIAASTDKYTTVLLSTAQHTMKTSVSALRVLYEQHSSTAEDKGQEKIFCGMHRILIPGGFVCWTKNVSV
jgi:hypothetical protein